eukprot:364111-Chlamydomonas_euryale.AAC.27
MHNATVHRNRTSLHAPDVQCHPGLQPRHQHTPRTCNHALIPRPIPALHLRLQLSHACCRAAAAAAAQPALIRRQSLFERAYKASLLCHKRVVSVEQRLILCVPPELGLGCGEVGTSVGCGKGVSER